jgi:hypothetical protein
MPRLNLRGSTIILSTMATKGGRSQMSRHGTGQRTHNGSHKMKRFARLKRSTALRHAGFRVHQSMLMPLW